MIKRISMWKLKDPGNCEEMMERLLSMRTRVDALKDIEVGINNTPHNSAYDIVFIGTFSDKEAVRQFDADKYHKEVGALVSSVKLDRKVVEFEC